MTDQNQQELADSGMPSKPSYIQWNNPSGWPDWFRKSVNLIFVLFMSMNVVLLLCGLYGLSIAITNPDIRLWMILLVIVALSAQFIEMVVVSALYVRVNLKAAFDQESSPVFGGDA